MYFRRTYPDGRIIDSTPVVLPEGRTGQVAEGIIRSLNLLTRASRRYTVTRMERLVTATASDWQEVPNDGSDGITPPAYRGSDHRPTTPPAPPPPASGGRR